MSENKNEIMAFALWHPEHGLHEPYAYEGPIAYIRSDDEGLQDECESLNREIRGDNRAGWRIVSVKMVMAE